MLFVNISISLDLLLLHIYSLLVIIHFFFIVNYICLIYLIMPKISYTSFKPRLWLWPPIINGQSVALQMFWISLSISLSLMVNVKGQWELWSILIISYTATIILTFKGMTAKRDDLDSRKIFFKLASFKTCRL